MLLGRIDEIDGPLEAARYLALQCLVAHGWLIDR
jgi:hypothetical protein